MDDISTRLQFYASLGYLLLSAVLVVYLGSKRLLKKASGKVPKSVTEFVGSDDALAIPLVGSMVLFGTYVLLRFIPLEYFNAMVSFYLCIVGVVSLGSFIKSYVQPSIVTGSFCCAVGVIYYWTNNWVANNILAIGIGVTAIEAVQLDSFRTSFIMLVGLFFYDIFWVFGSEVMIVVASGINGPIKLVVPRTLLGDQQSQSLLGLGDLVVPGFFIAQTLVFSSEKVKRGNLYFHIALVAYFLSLVNTMAVMVIFEHGQPALLFIVPYLLISFSLALFFNGDIKSAYEFDSDEVAKLYCGEEPSECRDEKIKSYNEDGASLIALFSNTVLGLFGLERTNENKVTNCDAMKKNN
ncbi:putative Signal peptide peptidase [Trypanosoma vivax]|uniref:Putative signal peptide peptidase n=1 Tax=Trypanosoma vivax (strain Y486) TaxID=1055687 RepID=G0TTH3_TRYVY|nr:putative signal peptide peptidase [Trypanosoma vivax]KAH8607257.1 putative Signal peptide peptidase [Trypanosoma vivax]CCC47254.1 putative signal peptide peptidase [Trypanosoma vivax Y486]